MTCETVLGESKILMEKLHIDLGKFDCLRLAFLFCLFSNFLLGKTFLITMNNS